MTERRPPVTILDVAPAGTTLPVSPLARTRSIATTQPLERHPARPGDAWLLVFALVAGFLVVVRLRVCASDAVDRQITIQMPTIIRFIG